MREPRPERPAQTIFSQFQLLESSHIAAFIIDTEHRIIFCNRAYETLTGSKLADIIHTRRQWSPFYAKKRQTLADLILDGVSEDKIKRYYGKDAHRIEYHAVSCSLDIFFPHLGKDGTWLFCTASPLFDADGTRVGAVETLQDFTAHKQIQTALFESQQKSETILDQMIDGYYEVDIRGRFTSFNDALCRILGFTREELLGKSYRVLQGGKDTQKIFELYNQVFRTREPLKAWEMVIFRTDGSKGYIQLSVSLIYDVDNVPAGFRGMVRDITEVRKSQAEVLKYKNHLEELVSTRTEKLKAAIKWLKQEIKDRKKVEERLLRETRFSEDIIEAIPGIFYVYDQEGRFLKWNRNVERLSGYSSEEMDGFQVMNLFDASEQPRIAERILEVFTKGKSSVYSFCVGKYGQRIPFFLTGVLTNLNNKDYLVGVGIDTAELEDAKKALQESEKRLRAILSAVTDYMVMIDKDYRVVWANEHAFQAFGEDLTDRYCYEALLGRATPCKPCIGMQCMQDGTSHEREGQIIRPDGTRMDFWNTVSVVSRDELGRPEMFLALFRDITEKKAYQAEAVRAGQLALLGELAAGVAHEINNPINGILNYTQILLDQSDQSSGDHLILERIAAEGERVAGIVANLLSFAREKKGEYATAPLPSILDATLGLVGEQLSKDGIALDIGVPSRLPYVFGNSQQLQQVFLNIISNARYALNKKYKGRHTDKILTITAEQTKIARQRMLRIMFHDHGTGIPEGIMDKICSPFFTTKPLNEGTGLGLHISHGIIKNHGGSLKFESSYGHFTKVIIELPAKGR